MSWQAHRATFECLHHGTTARALRALAFERRAPLCPRCRLPMTLQDQRGITDKAHAALIASRADQITAITAATHPASLEGR